MQAGTTRNASLFFVSPSQINFQVPQGTAAGTATVIVLKNGAQVAAGDGAAFEELMRRHRRLIAQVARRFFKRADEVEDLVHNSFVKAWSAIRSYEGRGADAFAAWLARITTNCCYDELRRRRRSRERAVSQLNESESECLAQCASLHTGHNLEPQALACDLASKLMAKVEAEDRKVFILINGGDCTIAEVAELMGWSESKVKMRVHRTKSFLRLKSRRLSPRHKAEVGEAQ